MSAVYHYSPCSASGLVIVLPFLLIVSGFFMMPSYLGGGSIFSADGVIIGSSLIGLSWAFIQFLIIRSIPVESMATESESGSDVEYSSKGGDSAAEAANERMTQRIVDIHQAIVIGAKSFLRAEYKVICLFLFFFTPLTFILVTWGTGDWDFVRGTLTTFSFILGAFTSMASGYLGMTVAVFANARTTVSAQLPEYRMCFNTAFRAGAVMGFALTGLAIIGMYILLLLYKVRYPDPRDWVILMETITGYGLGGSVIAMFGRVGGGIYTKAADVGADLVGKVIHGIPEDDPRNPATIADNVGDNVGDVAGMGSDLFGSFAESTCAALVLGASIGVTGGWDAVCYPIIISAGGLLTSILCSFLATNFCVVRSERQIEHALKTQLVSTTILNVFAAFVAAGVFLPPEFSVLGVSGVAEGIHLKPYMAALCVSAGAVGGLLIGLVTEYYTSHSYVPVRDLAQSCKTGAATNMIYGLALGYKSVVLPVLILSTVTVGSFWMGDLYGVSLAAIGFLSNLATGLTIDVYGPVCDNAGGIAEMAELGPSVREKTDNLDAAGNTTAAIGKGFAIGSAALVSLALFGAFVSRIRFASEDAIFTDGVNILHPITFGFLLVGGMIPYAFSAMTMKSVGKAAMEMVMEVQRQFDERPALLDGHERPDYDACIGISTTASLREMVAPAAMVIFTPLLTGFFFGTFAVSGLLVGSFVSSVQLAISMSNSGGAWDNAKKYIEKQPAGSELGGKGSEVHKAAVVGDTVGDPFKDTSGPALNIVMKLMAVLSLVFADAFYSMNNGHGLFRLSEK